MGRKKEPGTIIREWLTEKMGNPVMTSKKKNMLAEIEKEDQRQSALNTLQERGEDYSSRIHTK